jgi:hypothetical protein
MEPSRIVASETCGSATRSTNEREVDEDVSHTEGMSATTAGLPTFIASLP